MRIKEQQTEELSAERALAHHQAIEEADVEACLSTRSTNNGDQNRKLERLFGIKK